MSNDTVVSLGAPARDSAPFTELLRASARRLIEAAVTIQSGPRSRSGKTSKGNSYLKGMLGEAGAAAAKTNTFLGERYRRLVKRRGELKALVAVARSILVIVWHLLADPTARFHDLGADFYARRIDKERRIRQLVHQLQVLGHRVTLTPAA